MMNEQFYVTLPSNVYDSIHLYNTMANYSTELFSPISFNHPYEVALSEITFPTPPVAKDAVIGRIRLIKIPTPFHDTETNSHLNHKWAEFEVIKSDLQKDNFVDYLNTKLKEIADTMDCEGPPVLTKVHKMDDMYLYQLSKSFQVGYKLLVYGHLASLLGFRVSNDEIEQRYGSGTTGDLIRFDLPKLNFNINSLFIYTDIIEHQYVGNSYTQLLRCVPVDNKQESQTIIYSQPHYVPLNTNIINSIQITIKDDENHFINFPSGTEKVYIKLHFRPKQYGLF